MAVMVEPPVVQTSSTMTTEAPGWRKPSTRRPVPWVFSALRTRKPWMREGGCGGGVEKGWVVGGESLGEIENFVVFGESPGGGGGGIGDERVGAHGEAAYGDGVWNVFADEVVEDEAGEAAAFGVQGGGAAVDVVIGLLAGGKGEVAEAEGEGGDEVEEVGAVVWHWGKDKRCEGLTPMDADWTDFRWWIHNGFCGGRRINVGRREARSCPRRIE
jgi:hypothetical protein